MRRVAFITGITGQDGSYLAELLLDKGYTVHGLKRRSSSFNTSRIDHLYEKYSTTGQLVLHYGDLTESSSLVKLVSIIEPTEIYNLGAQSHVAVSFETPEYTADVNGLGALRLLEAIRFLGLQDQCRYYQASTSELFGKVQEIPQTEKTPFYPRSPYAVAKLYAYWIAVNYRESFGLFACNGILFNHESPRRGETFVTRKITRAIARMAMGIESTLLLGNLDAMRDWGHAADYVQMQWVLLQQDQPMDLVIASGMQCSVREFVEKSFQLLGVEILWEGLGVEERGVIAKVDRPLGNLQVGMTVVRVSPQYFRPAEVETLLGDSSLATELTGWRPSRSIDQMIFEMLESDLRSAEAEKILSLHKLSPASFLKPEQLL